MQTFEIMLYFRLLKQNNKYLPEVITS